MYRPYSRQYRGRSRRLLCSSRSCRPRNAVVVRGGRRAGHFVPQAGGAVPALHHVAGDVRVICNVPAYAHETTTVSRSVASLQLPEAPAAHPVHPQHRHRWLRRLHPAYSQLTKRPLRLRSVRPSRHGYGSSRLFPKPAWWRRWLRLVVDSFGDPEYGVASEIGRSIPHALGSLFRIPSLNLVAGDWRTVVNRELSKRDRSSLYRQRSRSAPEHLGRPSPAVAESTNDVHGPGPTLFYGPQDVVVRLGRL